jgi:hypothetical protein
MKTPVLSSDFWHCQTNEFRAFGRVSLETTLRRLMSAPDPRTATDHHHELLIPEFPNSVTTLAP